MYSISTAIGYIEEKISTGKKIDIVRLKNGEKAINYKYITGTVSENDRVLLNTTAVELKLGTGGYHFIICNLENFKSNDREIKGPGHIMKMRYTPQQVRTFCVEEKESRHRDKIKSFTDLEGKIVVILPLHSLLAPLAIVFKEMFPDSNFVYIMTEGGSLTIDVSFLVKELNKKNYIQNTITVGQCFGGDLETVNIFTGLAAASEICKADLIAVSMGPGITGTGTELGFSGVENAFTNYAIRVLGGRSYIVPRISLADRRSRHYLLSHHTITLLSKLIDRKTNIIFPLHKKIRKKIKELSLDKKHNIIYYKFKEVKKILSRSEFTFNSMDRSFTDDPLFFITGGLPVLKYKEIMEE